MVTAAATSSLRLSTNNTSRQSTGLKLELDVVALQYLSVLLS